MSSPKNSNMCNAGQFKRLKYFNGMLLTERDFCEEQDYLREKHKLNNRLHGAGVAWGLCLKPGCITVDKTEVVKIFIAAGLALDCAGNEIIVCKDYLVRLDEKIAELRTLGLVREVQKTDPTDPTGKKTITEYVRPKLFIGIRYCECDSQPAEQFTSECGEDDLQPQFSRVREGFSVHIWTEEEFQDCDQTARVKSGKTKDCGCAGLLPCPEEEMMIWLGCVAEYDITNDPPTHNLALIVNFNNALNDHWERQKQMTLTTVFKKEARWVDVSLLIGKTVTYFDDKMEAELKLKKGKKYQPAKMAENELLAVLDLAKDALPWARQGWFVDIVTDAEGKCIAFPLARKP